MSLWIKKLDYLLIQAAEKKPLTIHYSFIYLCEKQ